MYLYIDYDNHILYIVIKCNKNQIRRLRKQFSNVRDSTYVGKIPKSPWHRKNHRVFQNMSTTGFLNTFHSKTSSVPSNERPLGGGPTIIQATLQDGHQIHKNLAFGDEARAGSCWICVYEKCLCMYKEDTCEILICSMCIYIYIYELR